MKILSYIPKPPFSTINLGFVHIHIYAITMVIAIIIGARIAYVRYRAKYGITSALYDVFILSIVFGVIFSRLYHVLTDYTDYFSSPSNYIKIFYIWQGGLSIWGGILGGVLGAFIASKREGIALVPLLDAAAPGIAFAQAFGRLGNYFNQELFGAPTKLPWGLKVSDSITLSEGSPVGTLFHPTFLYESIWCLLVGFLIIRLEKKFILEHGQSFYLYIVFYCVGRIWIEYLRIDKSLYILGFRFNNWVCLIVGIFGLCMFINSRKKNKKKSIVKIMEDDNLTKEHNFNIENIKSDDVRSFKKSVIREKFKKKNREDEKKKEEPINRDIKNIKSRRDLR